jgi:SAM-dependent methyltransferase
METNWFELWRELTLAGSLIPDSELAKRYTAHGGKTHERPDQLLDFVLEKIGSETTVLDVGAGSGRWTIPLAKIAKTVTAVEPASAMLDKLYQSIADAKVDNVQVVRSSWEEADIKPHDIAVCAHATYASPDLLAFIRKMECCTIKTCCLAMRLPPSDGIIAELSSIINGQPHDSPNAIIAYNALYSAGIYANILVEDNIYNWADDNFEGAFARAKRHLNLQSSAKHDALIRDVLTRRLKLVKKRYAWPDGMRSALIWWNP